MGAEGNLRATDIEKCREAHAEVSRGHSRCRHEPKGRTLNLQKAFDPQVSPINADGSAHYPVRSYHLPGAPWVSATSLFYLRNLRHLRTELRFLG